MGLVSTKEAADFYRSSSRRSFPDPESIVVVEMTIGCRGRIRSTKHERADAAIIHFRARGRSQCPNPLRIQAYLERRPATVVCASLTEGSLVRLALVLGSPLPVSAPSS